MIGQGIFVQAAAPNLTGYVYDDRSKEPIPGAVVAVVYGGYWDRHTLTGLTDATGYFSLSIPWDGPVPIYVFKDNPETPGVDYVPVGTSIYVQRSGISSYVFRLKAGASIFVKSEIRFVESTKPSGDNRFIVSAPESPVEQPSIAVYGSSDLAVIGLNASHVVVPADTPVSINVSATFTPDISFEEATGVGPSVGAQRPVTRQFPLGEQGAPIRLGQGDVLKVDIRRYDVEYNMVQVKRVIDIGLGELWKAEDLGFLLNVEKEDLEKARDLLELSTVPARQQLYDEAFAYLRHAYILASTTTIGLRELAESASRSALVLTFFFALTSVGLIQLLVEGESHLAFSALGKYHRRVSLKPFYIGAIYVALLAAFYVAFPGCRLVEPWQFAGAAVFSLFFSLALLRVPKSLDKATVEGRSIAFGGAFVTAFSIAYRHLRRRRLRTVLTLITVVTLMFSFITLTSVSSGRGFVVQDLGPSKVASDALMIKDMSNEPFAPLPETFLKWLEGQPNVTAVALKAESAPQQDPLFYVWGRDRSYGIRGVIGVIPDLEQNITRINEVVVKGRYLAKDEDGGLLLSQSLAQKLELSPGAELYVMGRRFVVSGLFDEKKLSELKDVDGSSFLPFVRAAAYLDLCPPDVLVVTTYKTALTLPNVVTSRAVVLAGNKEDLLTLSGIVTLTYEYTTWASVDGRVQRMYVGGFVEEKGMGFTVFIALFMALIIGNTMLGAVAERRGELATLSSVGLNPGHISSLFLAEAIVIGFVGGGVGYLLGVSTYRPLSAIMGGLIVREKVSADWSLIALSVSILATVLSSVVPALRASTIVTPSLLRRWRLEESLADSFKPADASKPWSLDLPVKIRAKEADLFFAYMEKELRQYDEVRITGRGADYPEELGPPKDTSWTRRLSFTYLEVQRYRVSRNELVVTATPGEEFCQVRLETLVDAQDHILVQATGSFVRKLVFEWNAMVFKLVTAIDSLSQVYTLVDAYNPKLLYVVDTRKDTARRVRALSERWLREGTRLPKTVLVPMDSGSMGDCMKKADEVVAEANIVCVTGGPSSVSVALTLTALKHDRMVCYVDDPRPIEKQEAEPFYALRISRIELPSRK